MPGGQWVVPLGGCEIGGLFIGWLGVVGLLLGVLELVGAPMAETAAALNTKAERAIVRRFIEILLDGVRNKLVAARLLYRAPTHNSHAHV